MKDERPAVQDFVLANTFPFVRFSLGNRTDKAAAPQGRSRRGGWVPASG
jgi:hypothetical protein